MPCLTSFSSAASNGVSQTSRARRMSVTRARASSSFGHRAFLMLMPDTLASAKIERERGVRRERWSSSVALVGVVGAQTPAQSQKRKR